MTRNWKGCWFEEQRKTNLFLCFFHDNKIQQWIMNFGIPNYRNRAATCDEIIGSQALGVVLKNFKTSSNAFLSSTKKLRQNPVCFVLAFRLGILFTFLGTL
jgi:hypothetical protein